MTDVEALLRIDAGDRPADVQVSFERDPYAGRRRCTWLAVGLGVLTMAAALGEKHRPELLLVPIACLVSALVVWPSREEEDELSDGRPRVMLVTQRGLLVRDPWGIRNWAFADIALVGLGAVEGRVQMVLRDTEGGSHLIDHLMFDRGEELYQTIGTRLAMMREQTRVATHGQPAQPLVTTERERKPSSVGLNATGA